MRSSAPWARGPTPWVLLPVPELEHLLAAEQAYDCLLLQTLKGVQLSVPSRPADSGIQFSRTLWVTQVCHGDACQQTGGIATDIPSITTSLCLASAETMKGSEPHIKSLQRDFYVMNTLTWANFQVWNPLTEKVAGTLDEGPCDLMVST